MLNPSLLDIAIGNNQKAPFDWMSATQVRPFILEDLGAVWLKYHGEKHGLLPDKESPYEFSNFIFEKGRQFEAKWVKEIAASAIRVCKEAYEVTSADKVRGTFELMQKQTPIIYQSALWWAPEKINGVPDLLVHTSWLLEKSNELLNKTEKHEILELLKESNNDGFYIVFDLKFTTKLEDNKKATDFQNYASQVRIYSYMLGHLQGLMPQKAFIITRDKIFEPIPVVITSNINEPLDTDLAEIRDKFIDIKLNGDKYLPWRDEFVTVNIHNSDDQWSAAKKEIAWNKMPGKDSGLLYQIGAKTKIDLAGLGFPNLDSMLNEEPENIPFEKCKGLGSKRSKQIRAVLQANRTNSPVIPHPEIIPDKRPFEFFVDFEFFTNVNVDFEKQWPILEGCEMIFMIGVGWEENEKWNFKTFTAEKEEQQYEKKVLEQFADFLKSKTEDSFIDNNKTALFHWYSAEVSQTKRAIERHNLPNNHSLCLLPWYDMQKVFLNGPSSIPGAWDYGLKEVAKSLGKLYPEYDPQWPGELGEGLRAMVMGWRAYENEKPLETQEISIIIQYLEADCKALWNVLRWIRSGNN